MAQFVVANRVTALGKTFRTDRTTTTDGVVMKDPTLSAAKTGTLTTRTDANTGEITGQASHGVTTSAKIAIFWDGGSRYNVDVGTVAGNAIPIDNGGGDDLPDDETAVTIMVMHEEDFVVTTADLQALLCNQPNNKQAVVEFWESGPAFNSAVQITEDSDFVWTVDDGTTNPLDADIIMVKFAHADSTASRQVSALAFIN